MLNVCYRLGMENRVARMLELRRRGFSFQAIGDIFGVSRARVHQLTSGYGKLLKGMVGNGWYAKLREIILERDNYACSKCGAKDNLLVHHADLDDQNNELSNLVTLCNACHCSLHTGELKSIKELKMNSKEIQQLRKRLGLTQKELAARVKVDAITVSRWERAEQKPSAQAIKQLTRLSRKG